jgi:hypothetical protein
MRKEKRKETTSSSRIQSYIGNVNRELLTGFSLGIASYPTKVARVVGVAEDQQRALLSMSGWIMPIVSRQWFDCLFYVLTVVSMFLTF